MALVLRTKNIRGIGAFGELYLDGELIARSVEREWLDNKQNKSCVPAGTYKLEWTNSPRWGERLALVNEALNVSINGDTHRTHILIHPANYPKELAGCIAFGANWMTKWGVSDSRAKVNELEHIIQSRPDLKELTIIRAI